MDEKIIVQSEHVKIGGFVLFTVLFLVFLFAAIACFVAHPIMHDMIIRPYYDAMEECDDLMEEADNLDTYSQYKDQRNDIQQKMNNDPLVGFYWDVDEYYGPIVIAAAGLFFIIALILWIVELSLKRTSMTVTDKRVYGFAGRVRVDLPLDSVTAISLGGMKSVSVTSASGAIKFSLIKNRDEIYDAVSALLVERQNKKSAPIAAAPAVDNAEQIKKFKELFDNGIISEEEFEAKKKQLLGL